MRQRNGRRRLGPVARWTVRRSRPLGTGAIGGAGCAALAVCRHVSRQHGAAGVLEPQPLLPDGTRRSPATTARTYYPGISLGFYYGYPDAYGYPYGYYGYPYYSYPYNSGYGYYGADPYYGGYSAPYAGGAYPYAGGGYPYGGSVAARPGAAGYGEVRIEGAPKDAQVYADGRLVGSVGDFDGPVRHLPLEAGPHEIEIRMTGMPPMSYDVEVRPGQTISLHANVR